VTQTVRGKQKVFEVADTLARSMGLRRYDYHKEPVWTIPRQLAERLFLDFGHGSRKKRLPGWCLRLSSRQALLLWSHACLGDGTYAPDGDVYYTVNPGLAADLQAMLVSAGELCSVRGPYYYPDYSPNSFGDAETYQLYRPFVRDPFRCVDFKSRTLRQGAERLGNRGYALKEEFVTDRRVVCFEVPSGTLVTRSGGCVAIQGNSKFAYHIVRLLNEAEQILLEGDLDLMRNREQLKSIRRGEWTEKQILDYFEQKRVDLEGIRAKSTLPPAPDWAALRGLLLRCLEMHYGSLEGCVVVPGRAEALLRQVREMIEEAGF
jgi:hypothetical protein